MELLTKYLIDITKYRLAIYTIGYKIDFGKKHVRYR